MRQIDLDFVRGCFPAFCTEQLRGWRFFENAGGSYACMQVIDRLQRYYIQTKVQPDHAFRASIESRSLMEEARRRLAHWMHVGHDELHFGPSTSANTYVMAQAFKGILQPGDEVIVTNQDHEANIGAWRRLADHGVVVRQWSVNPDTHELDPDALEKLYTERTRLLAFTHCSNIVGSINPVRAIADHARSAGIVTVVDGVSFCPHGLPDIGALGVDVYLMSLYKVFGPHLGVMFVRQSLGKSLPSQSHFFNDDEQDLRFMPSGPDHAQIAAANGVIDYMEALWDRHSDGTGDADPTAGVSGLINRHECTLVQPLLDFLDHHQDVRLIGKTTTQGRAPTVAFTSETHPSRALGEILAAHRISAGTGNFYAWRLLEALGIAPEEGVVRLSMAHYNTPDEVAYLLEVLDRVLGR